VFRARDDASIELTGVERKGDITVREEGGRVEIEP